MSWSHRVVVCLIGYTKIDSHSLGIKCIAYIRSMQVISSFTTGRWSDVEARGEGEGGTVAILDNLATNFSNCQSQIIAQLTCRWCV